jgi:PIN domain nuclease of toxin-antitoxin system
MRLLLDTHIWVWNELEPWRLTSQVHRELASTQNELFLSPVSIWELVLLVEEKKFKIDTDFAAWVDASFDDLQVQEAPFTRAVAHELCFTVLPHRDPGDRFLVATARVYGLTLVTSDNLLLNLPQLPNAPSLELLPISDAKD